ncbi:MAG: FHA domain-containing protein, partial [Planctomycetaceae bacterium]
VNVKDVFAQLPKGTLACLKLPGERRQLPFRPLAEGTASVGSGIGCVIRLGQPGMPELHSVLEISLLATTIRVVGEDPPLYRNGEPCASAVLIHGDLLEIGDFRAVFLSRQPDLITTRNSFSSGRAESEQQSRSPAGKSASESALTSHTSACDHDLVRLQRYLEQQQPVEQESSEIRSRRYPA